jgi:hypothetical protein
VNRKKFVHNQLYFGCGPEGQEERYQDDTWDLCDIRDLEGVIKWDVLLGLPYCDGAIKLVKSKLTWGMFTYDQADFVMREVARVLFIGGEFQLTFRNIRLVIERFNVNGLSIRMLGRYLYGSHLYDGSQRKSCWDLDEVVALAAKYRLELISKASNGMNTAVFFVRIKGEFPEFRHEPKMVYDEKNRVLNVGGDFPGG